MFYSDVPGKEMEQSDIWLVMTEGVWYYLRTFCNSLEDSFGEVCANLR